MSHRTGAVSTPRTGHYCVMHDVQLCSIEVPRSMLMCKPHWFMVPSHLRTTINALWREHRHDILSLPEEYWEARELAVARVQAQLEAV
jgi:hypothetical protein